MEKEQGIVASEESSVLVERARGGSYGINSIFRIKRVEGLVIPCGYRNLLYVCLWAYVLWARVLVCMSM